MIKLCLDLLLTNLCMCRSCSFSMVKLTCVEGLHTAYMPLKELN